MHTSATHQPSQKSAHHQPFFFGRLLALGRRLLKHATPRCAIKALAGCVLTAACLTGPAHAQTTVIREYCEQNLFCYKGLNSEDAVATFLEEPVGVRYRVIPLPPTDQVISQICAFTGRYALPPVIERSYELIPLVVENFSTHQLHVHCKNSTGWDYGVKLNISARCPKHWMAYSGYHDTESGRDFALFYNFGTPEPGVAQWCQKRCSELDVYQSGSGCQKAINLGEPPPGLCAFNPIHAGTGNKFQAETDIEHPASPFKFRRYYNSHKSADTAYNPSGPLGKAWTHEYEKTIDVLKHPNREQAILSRPNGRIYELTAALGATVFTPTQPQSHFSLRKILENGKLIAWQLNDESQSAIETYTPQGRLSSIAYANGSALYLSYGDHTHLGPLTQIADHQGRAWQLAYDARGRIIKITSPDGSDTQFAYTDTHDLLVSVRHADGGLRSFFYNETAHTSANLPGLLTGIQDPTGQRTATYRYDASARAIGGEHGAGANKTTLSYQPNQTTLTDSLGSQRSIELSTIGGLVLPVRQSQPAGSGCGPASAQIGYDERGNVVSRIDFNGHKTCYAYDLTRNLETLRIEGLSASAACAAALASPPSDAPIRVIHTRWHPHWRLRTALAEPGRITTWTYNGQGAVCAPADALVAGQPIAVVCARSEQATLDTTGAAGFNAAADGPARTHTYTHNRHGQILSEDGPRTDVADITHHQYYTETGPHWTAGDLAQTTNPLGHRTRYPRYNRAGQVLERIDPNGLATRYTYDPRGRLTSTTVGDEHTRYTYDLAGKLTRLTHPDGSHVDYTYDAAGRLIGLADSAGNQLHYQLDPMGNRIRETGTDAGGQTTHSLQRAIDALGRVQRITGQAQ